MARCIRAGQMWINSWDACDVTMPFGGFKQSGLGRELGMHAMEHYTELKNIYFETN